MSLASIFTEIKNRVDTVTGLTVFSDVRQVNKNSIPAAVVELNRQTPSDENYKFSTKYKVDLTVSILLYHNSLINLLTLIEAVESAIKINTKLAGTIDVSYKGWTIAPVELGSEVYGANIILSVNYIRITE